MCEINENINPEQQNDTNGFHQLKGIFLCPSHECNANCVHCYEKFNGKQKVALTTENVKNVVDQFKQLGGIYVNYCSGEFLMRPDATELVRYTSQQNLQVVIVSNGILADEAKIEELKEAGLSRLVISIDSAIEARHDELRGVKGCFQKAVKALRIAKDKGLSTHIWTYISKTNSGELAGIAELAKQLKTDVAFVFYPLLSGHMFNRFEENLTYAEREMYRKQFNGIDPIEIEFSTENSVCRGGGSNHLCVMPSGEVTFCPPVPYSYGSIHKRPLKDILQIMLEDYNKFCKEKCTGQCIVNFEEYRKNCNAKYLYD